MFTRNRALAAATVIGALAVAGPVAAASAAPPLHTRGIPVAGAHGFRGSGNPWNRAGGRQGWGNGSYGGYGNGSYGNGGYGNGGWGNGSYGNGGYGFPSPSASAGGSIHLPGVGGSVGAGGSLGFGRG
jgi:hypothetical protein